MYGLCQMIVGVIIIQSSVVADCVDRKIGYVCEIWRYVSKVDNKISDDGYFPLSSTSSLKKKKQPTTFKARAISY